VLLAISAGALAFDLTLPWRLPSEADWAEAAGALRARAAAGDVVQLWPPWAERARQFIDAAPVVLEEDLAAADYVGAQRLWLLTLPRVPYAGVARARQALLRRGAVRSGELARFGALELEAWELRAPPLAADLTPGTEEHEVDYVARRCLPVAINRRWEARGTAGAVLHLRAGIIGERAYDAGRPPILVTVLADGTRLGTLEIAGAGWRALDVPLVAVGADRGGASATADGGASAAERVFTFAVSSPDEGRPFCLRAWTTR
jgi:hypothetical protein